MATLKDFFNKIEKVMASVAFAEAGEFETAKSFLKASKNANKKVLLSTDRTEINDRIVRHALKLCQRMEGRLEILHVLNPADGKAEQLIADLRHDQLPVKVLQNSLSDMNIQYQLTWGEGCLADEVLKHTEKRRDIICVIFDVINESNKRCKKAQQNMVAKLQAFKCPVVMYS